MQTGYVQLSTAMIEYIADVNRHFYVESVDVCEYHDGSVIVRVFLLPIAEDPHPEPMSRTFERVS